MALAVSIAAVWVLVALVLWRVRPAGVSLSEALRLGPDVVRLCRRLLADGSLPRAVRLWVGFLVAYLLSPIDLIPDVVPLIGYADDVLVVVLVLRSIVKRAGPVAIERHWPGSQAGLDSIRRLAGLSPSAQP